MRLTGFLHCTTRRRAPRRLPLLGLLCLALGFASCESIFDENPDCRLGIALKFVYDYHMEPGADAFASNVDCVSVLVFDAGGNYLTQFTETSDILRDADYRMELPLDPGDYHLVVYGGLACADASFTISPDWAAATRAVKDEIRVTLPLDERGVSDKQLHDIEQRTGGLFYGTLDVSLSEDDLAREFREETVYLMKDTNNIQVILQELSNPYQVDFEDYHFYIIDDNFVLDGYNRVIHTATEDFRPHYLPYAAENRIMGYVDPGSRNGQQVEEDEERPVQVACAEFATSRLLIEHLPTAELLITSSKEKDAQGNDQEIIRIPLLSYLTAVRGFGDSWIKSDQEFLDRQSRWTLMFFLQKNVWIRTTVSVNWWTVRINEVTLG